MAISCFPSAAFKMIWARWAKRTETEVLRATLSNSACCAGKRQISGATLMPGRLMVANRSVKQYVILFTTHNTRLSRDHGEPTSLPVPGLGSVVLAFGYGQVGGDQEQSGCEP